MTRRQLLSLPLAALAAGPGARAQLRNGMASRGVKPVPRGKPSGLPFNAQFVNVAQSAGLRSPVIYGGEKVDDYIVDSMGCGVAFIDYDNDGWQDIVVAHRTPLAGHAGRGHHPPVPQQPRRHVYAMSPRASGLGRSVLGLRHHRGRLRQRRLRGHLHHLLGPEHPVPQQRRRHLHRCDREGGLVQRGSLRHGLHLDRLRPRRQLDLFVCHYLDFDPDKIPPRGRTPTAIQGRSGQLRSGGLSTGTLPLYHNNGDGTFTDVSEKAGILESSRGYR